jgi:hypothetical protein
MSLSTCKVVEILRGRFAIAVVDGIGNHHRRAAGREVHARPLYLTVVLRILSVKNKVALGLLQRLFNNRARHPESAIVTEDSADSLKPTSSRMRKILSLMAATSISLSGLYCPPGSPGLTGLMCSASGALRNACLACLPPDRRAIFQNLLIESRFATASTWY